MDYAQFNKLQETVRILSADLKRLKRRVCCVEGDGGGGGGAFTLFTQNTPSISLFGTGEEGSPLFAQSNLAPVQNGIISGGEVTWISGYTYSVSPAFYYINGQPYVSPYTEITLDPADLVNNRIDSFVLTTSGTAIKITGVASPNPEQPSINTATQIQASFALVVANTVSPSPAVSQEFIYRNNLGTPGEWAATSSANINVASPNNTLQGAATIEGTAVVAGNSFTSIRVAPTAVGTTKNVLVFYIRSKATWNANRRLNLQFKNGVTNIGTSVAFGQGLFGFDSSITASYQRIVIPTSAFGIAPADLVDTLTWTASGNGGTLGFYIDDIELQGANIPAAPAGTTDNVGVFYVSRNFSGIAGAVVTGLTLGTITSSNAGYNTQMLAARMGDMNKAYPCPWSARNAALMAISAGTITKAYIHVIGGAQYTVGSNVAANNGTTAGVVAATVADIQFASGNTTVNASLMKNNVYYYFEKNSGLTLINRTYAIHAGCHNVDGTHTAFRSGINGYGFFIQIFGNEQSPIISQRFIEVNNTRCEIVLEADRIIMQRAWLFVFSFSKIGLKSKTFITDGQSSLIAYAGTVDANDGDLSPTVVDIDIENVYQGFKYYPYPSIQTGVNVSRPLISNDVNQNNRIKHFTYKFKNVFQYTSELGTLYNGFVTGINRNISNYNMTLTIDNLFQENDPVLFALQTGYAPLINPIYSNGNQIYTNVNEVFNIKNASTDAGLFRAQTTAHSNASSVNNSVVVNIDYAIRRQKAAASTIDYMFGLVVPQVHVSNSNTVVGEKPSYRYNIKRAIAKGGKAFANTGWINGAITVPGYVGALEITGTFITFDGSPVIVMNGTGNAFVLKDAVLIAKGAATNTIEVNNGGNPVSIYTKDTFANLPYQAGITHQGTLMVDPAIANYL